MTPEIQGEISPRIKCSSLRFKYRATAVNHRGSVQKVAKTLVGIAAHSMRKSFAFRQCTRQGSNLQPCDPKSHTLSKRAAVRGMRKTRLARKRGMATAIAVGDRRLELPFRVWGSGVRRASGSAPNPLYSRLFFVPSVPLW